jgi:hypothetical protein
MGSGPQTGSRRNNRRNRVKYKSMRLRKSQGAFRFESVTFKIASKTVYFDTYSTNEFLKRNSVYANLKLRHP